MPDYADSNPEEVTHSVADAFSDRASDLLTEWVRGCCQCDRTSDRCEMHRVQMRAQKIEAWLRGHCADECDGTFERCDMRFHVDARSGHPELCQDSVAVAAFELAAEDGKWAMFDPAEHRQLIRDSAVAWAECLIMDGDWPELK